MLSPSRVLPALRAFCTVARRNLGYNWPMKIAALFPGQGSQAVGMSHDLYEHNDSARALLERAFQVLPGLEKLMFEGPEDDLKLTENAQPALVAAGIAAPLLNLLISWIKLA